MNDVLCTSRETLCCDFVGDGIVKVDWVPWFWVKVTSYVFVSRTIFVVILSRLLNTSVATVVSDIVYRIRSRASLS